MTMIFPLLGRFALGLGISFFLSWVALRWLGPRGFLDHPVGRKCHTGAVPRTGGVAFLVTVFMGIAFAWCVLPLSPIQWAGLIAMAGIGLADDRFCLRARYKAVVGLGVAAILAYVGALSLMNQQAEVHLLTWNLPDSMWAYFVLLLMYFWCVPQSFNLVDGMNGLAMGYAVVVMGALGLSGAIHPYTTGAVVGLLIWNWPRAWHFLGDCGSMSLGLLLALLVMHSFGHSNPNLILWIFAYPFLDTTMVVVVRLAKGRHPAKADRGHLHHLWQDALGGRKKWVVPILLIQAAACASAVVVKGWGWAIPCLGLLALVSQTVWFSVQEVHKSRKRGFRSPGRSPLVVSD